MLDLRRWGARHRSDGSASSRLCSSRCYASSRRSSHRVRATRAPIWSRRSVRDERGRSTRAVRRGPARADEPRAPGGRYLRARWRGRSTARGRVATRSPRARPPATLG